ncbi:hypothetical protein [Armatimonas sp.]|uniref:hypothetical protein n=1 Tax=Armatimonas sp. TaxID=1872638 RepID=UPI00286D3AF8|nr:hypothetical protein [Armatimonas sp.]
MIVYIVQKRHWQFNDDYYILEDSSPIRGFESGDDAESYRLQCEEVEHNRWKKMEETYAKSTDWFKGEEGVKAPFEYPFFEVIVAELEP